MVGMVRNTKRCAPDLATRCPWSMVQNSTVELGGSGRRGRELAGAARLKGRTPQSRKRRRWRAMLPPAWVRTRPQHHPAQAQRVFHWSWQPAGIGAMPAPKHIHWLGSVGSTVAEHSL